MKRIIAVFMALLLTIGLTACSSTGSDGSAEIALIISGDSVEDGSYNQTAWESIKDYCKSNDLTCNYYSGKDDALKTAVDNGAKLVIYAGSEFETTVFNAQKDYPGTKFFLIDGIPHDENENYAIGDNTLCALFAEEEAGFVAGYAAVKEGYKNLGFMGGKKLPSVKRYGYGYVQGIAKAAEEDSVKNIEIRYTYTGTFDKSKEVKDKAQSWYKDGVQVIFACGGMSGESVMKGAEKSNGKVIGVDSDQSMLSDTVITSAKKRLGTAIEDVLKEYVRGTFKGGNVFNFSARNDGISIELTNGKLDKFTKDDYTKIMQSIISGETAVKKDTDFNSLSDAAGSNIKVIEE